MAKLLHKLQITGHLVVETGLHIGGSEVELDIGGIDKEVVKIKEGKDKIPFIPGSSLKGKLRNLLARKEGYDRIQDDQGAVLKLFGRANAKHVKMVLGRLIVRDSYIVDQNYQLEDKAENTITRLSGVAKPRHIERVSKGSIFGIDMIMDVYNQEEANQLLRALDMGFQLLQKDYLGGSGTRGYGKVSVNELSISKLEFKKDGSIARTTEGQYVFKVNQEA